VRFFRKIVFLGLIASQTTQAAVPMPSPDSIYGRQLFADITLDRYLDIVHRQFQSQDADGDGLLTSADIRARAMALAAEQRASQFSQFVREDLNGDGVITEAEVRAYYRSRANQFGRTEDLGQQARDALQIQGDMAADANHDGRITLREAYDFVVSRTGQAPAEIGEPITMFDPAPKSHGAVSWDAVRITATTYFNQIDRDHDGQISSSELATVRNGVNARGGFMPRLATMQSPQAGCDLPKPSNDAQIVLLSAYQGAGLSSVTIGSQDVQVNAATVNVAPGPKPIYVVITSFRPVIWRFTGAAQRIERAVFSSGISGPQGTLGALPSSPPLAGATGLPASRVSFPKVPHCLNYFSVQTSIGASMTAGKVASLLGRAPDTINAEYAVSSFDLPSGAIHKTGRDQGLIIKKSGGSLMLNGSADVTLSGGADSLARDVLLYYPDGVVTIDPTAVVASQTAQNYVVLPNQAGLQQLVQQGALTVSSNGEFQIRRKIHFPAELYGAHAARFLLMKGVPLPDGDPGHSCVVSQDTGQPLANASLCH
jgi:Ca2+-binding EF-hand superfamily protein